MRTFVRDAPPGRVVFGTGTLARVPEELDRLGRTALLLSTRSAAAAAGELRTGLGSRLVGEFTGAAMHTPVEVTERALGVLRDSRAEVLVAVGGGSAIGLAKALALRTDLPQLVVPTTYAGSEMTAILGETAEGRKRTQRSPAVRPEVVVYDVDLTLGLPPGLSATSGLNALAHAVEALYAPAVDPLTTLAGTEAVRLLAGALQRVVAAPADRAARTDALTGAWLAGGCLGVVPMGLHHKLCHLLGGTYDLPHAPTHAVVLPHVAAFNAAAAPEALGRVAAALGSGSASDAAAGLFALGRTLRAPRSLRELGMPEEGVDEICARAARDPYANPRPVDADGLRPVLRRAWAGDPPA